ncbi:MAG: phosphatase PAP2 family protein [Ignavibacteriae bacterium HGW-Ignavibacteriae-3]|nr:MAG: phosphatase PAP2 family protein [Ignavibacteriae bacterium HGW-Ignavibacteriae-3]
MADLLYQIDVWLLYFINHTLSNPLFNKFFPFITEVKNWYIAYIILFLVLIIKGGRLGRIASLFLILLIISTDQFSSFFLKNLFERIRPCNVFGDLNVLVTCTESFSFPSSHAVNNFAAAMFFGKIFPKMKWSFFTVAFLEAFSRPYVGVHYPSDVFGGTLIGLFFGYIYAMIVLMIDSKINNRNRKITDKYERIEFK